MRLPPILRLPSLHLLWRGLGLGLLAAAISLGMGALEMLDPLEQSASRTLFRLRGPRAPQSRIVLLVVDDATMIGRSQLPRSDYARVVRALNAAGARTIAFDVLISTAYHSRAEDLELARACAQSRANVVQSLVFDLPSSTSRGAALDEFPLLAMRDRNGSGRLAFSVATPLKELLGPRLLAGHLNVRPEANGEFRRVPHSIRFGQRVYPSLSLTSAALELGANPRAIEAQPRALEIETARGVRRVFVDENGEALVNWCGGKGAFPTYSFVDVFNNRVPARVLRGATVLIGSDVVGSFTPISTPFSRPLPSPPQTLLDLQANAFDDIVSNRVLRPVSPFSRFAWVLGLSMLAGLVIAPRGAVGALGWTLGLSVILWLSATLLLSLGNVLLSPAAAQMAIFGTAIGCLGVRQMREGRDLKRVSELFGGYVGDEVLRMLQHKNPKLDGEIRHVAVLFCDVRGFSTLAEQLKNEPETLLRLLNEHFEPVVASLKNHGAYIDNYVGDLVMAVFGAPVSEQTADRNTRDAVLAALDVVRVVNARNAALQAQGLPWMEIGVGVHCGPAVVGALGTSKKRHYTAIGDTVNIAARVESATRKYDAHLLVTEEVVRACRDHPDTANLPWRFVDETLVKNRQSLVRLYAPGE